MSNTPILSMRSGEPMAIANVPVVGYPQFRETLLSLVKNGQRVAAFFGVPDVPASVTLFAVTADDSAGMLSVISSKVMSAVPSLTPECPQVHLFEREIAEQCGVVFQGHPWMKPVRFPQSIGGNPRPTIGTMDFFTVDGEEVHEVAVGPVHAGVIEPGHFRFQCHGENVFHLEISLGYQHRGIETSLIGGPDLTTRAVMETIAGDTTAGHTTAYCQLVEALSNCTVPARAKALRGIALELERCANHTGDLGALAGDVGFLPTASYCGRIRGDFLNLTALLCGSRFGRGFVREGGTRFDCDDRLCELILEKLASMETDLNSALELLFSNSTVTARFENTGTVSAEQCRALGIVGIAARASNLMHDVRYNFPTGIYTLSQVPVVNAASGDVFARAFVRQRELQCSIAFVRELLASLPTGKTLCPATALRKDSLVVSMVEGWRGEICHVALTDRTGAFLKYKIVDPSFHNWSALALSLRNQQISDFPLCNKSFNLSYCGFDL